MAKDFATAFAAQKSNCTKQGINLLKGNDEYEKEVSNWRGIKGKDSLGGIKTIQGKNSHNDFEETEEEQTKKKEEFRRGWSSFRQKYSDKKLKIKKKILGTWNAQTIDQAVDVLIETKGVQLNMSPLTVLVTQCRNDINIMHQD